MKQPFRHKWIVIAAAALSLSLLAAALALVLKGTAGPPRSLLETASRPFLRLFSAASEQSLAPSRKNSPLSRRAFELSRTETAARIFSFDFEARKSILKAPFFGKIHEISLGKQVP